MREVKGYIMEEFEQNMRAAIRSGGKEMIGEIRTRKSTRKYKDTPVTDEQVMQLIESARLAPSGMNTQPWNFIIVRNKETREKLARASGNQKWMSTAPVYIVCVADIRCRLKEELEVRVDERNDLRELKAIIRDTAIATTQLLLEAESMGLASCWIAMFVQDDIRPILGIPEDKYVVGIVLVGHSDEDRGPTPRREIESMVRYEKW